MINDILHVKYIHVYTHIYTSNRENEFRVHCDVPIYSSVLTFPLFTERWYKVHVCLMINDVLHVKYIYTHIYTSNCENEFRVHCGVPIYT